MEPRCLAGSNRPDNNVAVWVRKHARIKSGRFGMLHMDNTTVHSITQPFTHAIYASLVDAFEERSRDAGTGRDIGRIMGMFLPEHEYVCDGCVKITHSNKRPYICIYLARYCNACECRAIIETNATAQMVVFIFPYVANDSTVKQYTHWIMKIKKCCTYVEQRLCQQQSGITRL